MVPAIFAVMAVLIVSACAATKLIPWATPAGGTIGGNGIVLTSFSATNDDIQGKCRKSTLTLSAENQGGDKIDTAMSCLFASNFNGDTDKTKVNDGLWVLDTTHKLCQAVNKILNAPDFENNVPGGIKDWKWDIISPFLQETLSRTDTFTGRVYYKFTSTAQATVWFYSESELQAAKDRGEAIPSTLSVIKTKGPIEITIDTKQPATETPMTLKITFSNVGGGTVFKEPAGFSYADSDSYPPTISGDDLYKFSATLSAAGLGVTECNTELSEIVLTKGATIVKTCDVTYTPPTTKMSQPITVTATYAYYTDANVPIKVSGKRGENATSTCT